MTGKRFLILALALTAALPAAASNGYGYYDDEGFFLFLDGALSQPGDTDQVVGITRFLPLPGDPNPIQATFYDAVEWDEGVSGTFGLGYRWGSSRVSVSYWQFDDDQAIAFDGPSGGYVNFTIGPAFYLYSGVYYPVYNLGSPGNVDFRSSLEATTADVTYEHTHQLNDVFDLSWSVGLRFASFEEQLEGTYDLCASTGCEGFYAAYPFNFVFGDVTFAATKTNESDMAGLRVGIGGAYYPTDTFAIRGDLALSELAGKVESFSALLPIGVVNGVDPPTAALIEDDNRSGAIRELGVALEWALVDRRLRIALGYRQSRWEGISTDLLRNPPGLLTPNRERDQVTFTGPYVGVRYDF